MGHSTLRQIVADLLNLQNTDLNDLLRMVTVRDRSAEDVTYELRRRTQVRVSSRTVKRWADSLKEES